MFFETNQIVNFLLAGALLFSFVAFLTKSFIPMILAGFCAEVMCIISLVQRFEKLKADSASLVAMFFMAGIMGLIIIFSIKNELVRVKRKINP